MMKTVITYAALLFGAILPAIGLADVASQSRVEVRFLAERAIDNLGKVLLVNDDVRTDAFELPMNNLSSLLKAPARQFNIWSLEKEQSLGTIQLPKKGNSFLVLLILSAEETYSSVVIPFVNPAFKAGDYYFHNNTEKTVLGLVGTVKFELEPGKGKPLHPKVTHKENFYDVEISVKEADATRVIKTTKWPKSKNSRSYVFFYVNPKTKRITFRGVDEFVIPKEATNGNK
jgi:hypothetical protein